MERRCEELLRLQRGIVAEHNNSLQGKVVEVLVEEELEDLPPFSFLGRTPWDAPEVDQGIYLELPDGGPTGEGSVASAWVGRPRPGELVSAEVVGAIDFDLEGVLIKEPPR
jgi:tRNA A37 methylthiotransferase MiaB